jgi:prolipoprotein diacylglyceryltransferase
MFPIPAAPLLHFLLETLAVVIALAYYHRLRSASEDPIINDHRTLLLIAAAFGAFTGSRLIGALENPTLFFGGGGENGLFYYLRSKTIVGGLLGGLVCVELTKRLIGIPYRSGDVYVFPLLVAMIIGRIGCFLMGIQEPTFGTVTTAWMGMNLGDGLLRHPTSLYEIAFLTFLFWAGTQVQKKWVVRPGRLFMFFMCGYLLYRLGVGFIQPAARWVGLSAIQWSCVGGLCWYLLDERLPSASNIHPAYARR